MRLEFFIIYPSDYPDVIINQEPLAQRSNNNTVIDVLKNFLIDNDDIDEDDQNKKYETKVAIANSATINKDIINDGRKICDMPYESMDNEMTNNRNNKRH